MGERVMEEIWREGRARREVWKDTSAVPELCRNRKGVEGKD